MKSSTQSGTTTTYAYDGSGRRVSKSSGKIYWYGSGGEILAETNSTGGVTAEYIFFGGKRIAMLPATGTPIYYVSDMLGSSRIVTSNLGVTCYDADFYPYGGERSYTNTCPQNVYKFEGKERDSESGNDNFGARSYSNRFGRWLSADWSAVPVPVPYANLTNPQTLNLYSMVADDPESFADLDGHTILNHGPMIGESLTWCSDAGASVPCSVALQFMVDPMADAIAWTESQVAQDQQKANDAAPKDPPQETKQPELVVVPDKKKPLPLPGGTEQYVDYNINSMDSSGKVTPLPQDNDHKVELKEKLLKGSAGVCDGGRNCTDVGTATDRMVVTPGKGHSVEKRFEIDGKAARIYDPGSKKAYDFVRVDASVKKGFVFNYGNDPQ